MQVPRALLLLALFAQIQSPAAAQLVLPGKRAEPRKEKPGNLAPHHVCLTCEQRSYELMDDGRRDDQGNVVGWCATCKRDTSQRLDVGDGSKNSRGGGRRLLLPPTPSRTARPATTAAATAPLRAPSAPADPARADHAAYIFEELGKRRRPDDSLTERAVESLLGLGEEGLAAARERLSSDDAAALLTSARVLLRSQSSEDHDLVCQRLRGKLPVAAGPPLLGLVASADPVRAGPKLLAELLDHPHVGVRVEAQKRLEALALPEADLVPLLEPALASRRADTRRRAIELAAKIEGPAATKLILDRVADPSSSVVAAVADGLSGRSDADLDARLLGLALRERWVLRPGACALLALVEREDRAFAPILDESHVEPLLTGLQSGDPFLSGACACALAGIGFRSRDPNATQWLERDVVDRLVTSVSGKHFHADLPALTGPALRRLELLTGQAIGSDGPAWIAWWVQAREGFFARRAWLELVPGDVGRITVRYRQSGAESVSFTLLGPENEASAEDSGQDGLSETVRLDPTQARDLAAALEREGIFGPERLPGVRGLRAGEERTLQVLLGSRAKSFTFGPGQSEPWFERAASLARDLLDRNRWQRYPDPARHASARDLWLEQSAWWSEEHADAERTLRMKSLVLAALPSSSPARRDQGIAEIERLYSKGAGAEPSDFAPLSSLLSEEPYWADRPRRLLDLCLEAARAVRPIGEEGIDRSSGAEERPHVPPEQGRVLLDLLVEKLPTAPPSELARVFAACGAGFADTMASDPRPTVRAVAARALADPRAGPLTDPSAEPLADPGAEPLSPASTATLLRLLGDPDAGVEAAAVEALGHHRVEAARTELLVRARLGLPEVRAPALRAIGLLGGEFVLDALSLAAAGRDPQVRLAAAWGLADLADPAATSLLIEMLGGGEGSPLMEPARAGLAALGPAAWDELLRVMHSQSHGGRREAALLLARQGVPEAASALIAILSTSPRDAHVASELSVLSGVDLRAEGDAAAAWWGWWDGVVHDDSTAWFLAALSRAGASPPAAEDLQGVGSRTGRLFLLEVLSRRENHLVERARRELSRMLGADLGALPPRGESRDAWIAHLRESVAGSEAR